MKYSKSFIMLAIAAALTSCSEKGWGVKGTVENAPADTKIAVEGFNAGIWYNIDSVEVASDGSFAYQAAAGAQFPEVYRLGLNGQSIYFPIDSIETVTVKARADAFDSDYSLEGSQLATDMMQVDQRIAKAIKERGVQAVLADSLLKRDLSIMINDDRTGVLGYYIINKTVGDSPLFAMDTKADVRVLGALANKFATSFPDDPRTQYLAQRFISARAAVSPTESTTSIAATVTGLLDIEYYDANGKKQKLSDVASGAGITLLSFTSYQIEPSVPYNVELNRMAELFKQQGLKIYQVSIDEDEVMWRKNAINLPWTAVWYDAKDNGALLRMYNVSSIPATYIIDRNSDLVDRVDNPADLEATIRKHL